MLFPFGYLTEILFAQMQISHVRAIWPNHLTFCVLTTLTVFEAKYRLWSAPLYEFLQFPIISSVSGTPK
jgi:hypothetical protein